MNERHFEILKEMIVDFDEYSTDYTKTRCKEIEQVLIDTLDYITTLQEKINQYENPDDMTLFYMWLDEKAKDKLKKLQEEKENIKEKAKNYLDIYDEMFDYKSRVEKAVEYIKKHIQKYDIDGSVGDFDEFDMLTRPNYLLNILQNESGKDE